MSMQRSIVWATALIVFAGGTFAQGERSTDRRQEIDADTQATLEQLFAANPGARELYDRAAGYAVFAATKAGFIVSGGSGTGVAVNKGTGARTYMRMGTGGIGLGIGAQRYNMIILFENQSQLDRFKQGGWDSSATAQVAAGQEGVAVRSSFINGIAIFQLTDRGLMAHADVSGTRFWAIEDLNAAD